MDEKTALVKIADEMAPNGEKKTIFSEMEIQNAPLYTPLKNMGEIRLFPGEMVRAETHRSTLY